MRGVLAVMRGVITVAAGVSNVIGSTPSMRGRRGWMSWSGSHRTTSSASRPPQTQPPRKAAWEDLERRRAASRQRSQEGSART